MSHSRGSRWRRRALAVRFAAGFAATAAVGANVQGQGSGLTAQAAPTQPQAPAGSGNLPWATSTGTSTAPGFLDTADKRIRDERAAPSKEELAALKELDTEVGRFTKIGGSYRDTLVALLRREYLRKRYAQDQSFGRQVKAEEDLEDKSRLDAIALFERFVAKYPDDERYSPDAMFRLGELYFERDAILQQQAMEAYMEERDKQLSAGAEPPPEPAKNFNPTIDLYRTLIRQFPKYERVDGVYYLIGHRRRSGH
jgi:hypothetical protein